MKRKTILRTEWKGIFSRRYAEKRFCAGGISGMAGLMYMTDAEDFFVRSGGERIQITGKNYSWLQLAPENGHVWATVMFDETGRLFQCYFDITAGNCVLDSGKSCFEDLYLDVVVKTIDDRLYFYDEEELEEAFKSGEINSDLRKRAYDTREELASYIERHRQAFFDFCIGLRNALMPELKNE